MSFIFSIIPELIILSSLSIVIVSDLFLKDNQKYYSYYFLQLTLLFTLSYLLFTIDDSNIIVNEIYDTSIFSHFVKIFLILTLIIIFSFSYYYLINFKKYQSEYFMIIMFGLLGMMIMVSSNHLLILYLGIELLSLALYTIIAYNKDSLNSAEAAVKYYVLGAMSSGFLLFGISLIYGLTGSLLYDDIVTQITSMNLEPNEYSIHSIGLIFALTFILISIAFKFGAAPFHMWLPDVYQGSLTPTTLMLSTIPKVAIFIVMIKLTNSIFSDLEIYWSEMILILSVLSILVGNLVAIVQTNIKRLLAYSTIANVGFILLGIYTGPTYGYSAALFYTVTYTLFTTAAFGLLCELKIDTLPIKNIKDLSGLNYKYPSLAILFLIIMLSMIGIPPFLGFYAKFYIIQSLVMEDHVNLAVFAVMMTVVGSFYYLRVIKVVYFDELNDRLISISSHLISYILIISLIIIGLFPDILSSLAFYSISNL